MQSHVADYTSPSLPTSVICPSNDRVACIFFIATVIKTQLVWLIPSSRAGYFPLHLPIIAVPRDMSWYGCGFKLWRFSFSSTLIPDE